MIASQETVSLVPGSFKDQTDVLLKVSDQIDGYWRMFMWVNVVIVGAAATPVVEKTLTIKLLILLYYSAFLYLNYGALMDGYKGLHAVCEDLSLQLRREPKKEAEHRMNFKNWILKDLDYSRRAHWVNVIFSFAIFFTAVLYFWTYILTFFS